ncbi:MAG: DNA-binding NarL/FixJ family response regulator [Sphingobacteriales bacterium]
MLGIFFVHFKNEISLLKVKIQPLERNEHLFKKTQICCRLNTKIILVKCFKSMNFKYYSCFIGVKTPGMSGIQGIPLIKSKFPDCDVVMQTIHSDNERIFAALCAGAIGYF